MALEDLGDDYAMPDFGKGLTLEQVQDYLVLFTPSLAEDPCKSLVKAD